MNKDDKNNLDFISGLGESDYENEDLFDVEVSNEEKVENSNLENDEANTEVEIPIDYDFFSNFSSEDDAVFRIGNDESIESSYIKDDCVSYDKISNEDEKKLEESEEDSIEEIKTETEEFNNSYDTLSEDENLEELEKEVDEISNYDNEGTEEENLVEDMEEANDETESFSEDENAMEESEIVNEEGIDKEFFDDSKYFDNGLDSNEYEIPVVEPTVITMSDTSIEELNKLTEYEQDKISTTDIKSLFDRVGVNVKEASDIFRKNTEMKEKIDTRFEELKKLQSEVEKAKKTQYDEINSYKEEVLSKLTEKKDEIEKRLNKLKDFQATLEKEREEFEKYKKSEKEEIEKVQREIQEAYEGRREELSHIEDILRKQKDALDEERSQLSLDRIQYESDKNELANNLLKFNEIVDSFTNGMDKINKE